MNEHAFLDGLIRYILDIVQERLDRHRQDLSRTTGTLPPNQLPPAGGSGGGGGGTPGAVILSDDDPQPVAALADPGSSGAASRADHIHALPDSLSGGRFAPLTNGDLADPQLVFAGGDVIMVSF